MLKDILEASTNDKMAKMRKQANDLSTKMVSVGYESGSSDLARVVVHEIVSGSQLKLFMNKWNVQAITPEKKTVVILVKL